MHLDVKQAMGVAFAHCMCTSALHRLTPPVPAACALLAGAAGDSRAVLSRAGVAIQVTDDHKPEREDEAVSGSVPML